MLEGLAPGMSAPAMASTAPMPRPMGPSAPRAGRSPAAAPNMPMPVAALMAPPAALV